MEKIPYGYCHCGCGQRASIAKRNRKERGQIKGKPLKFLPGHNSKPKNPEFFCRTTERWYVWVNGKSYPRARLIMENILGRPLKPTEHVHHIDGNQANDSPENLTVVSNSKHQKIHRFRFDDMFLLLKLRHFKNLTGRVPTAHELRRTSWMPSAGAYQNHFGTWNNALKEAGLK